MAPSTYLCSGPTTIMPGQPSSCSNLQAHLVVCPRAVIYPGYTTHWGPFGGCPRECPNSTEGCGQTRETVACSTDQTIQLSQPMAMCLCGSSCLLSWTHTRTNTPVFTCACSSCKLQAAQPTCGATSTVSNVSGQFDERPTRGHESRVTAIIRTGVCRLSRLER